jgi:large subunit ribosomal protein L3
MKILGKKLGMTSVYNEKGVYTPVTVIELGPCPITQIKTVEKDGYSAVQIGLADGMKKKNLTKAVEGHLKKSESKPMRTLREERVDDVSGLELGKVLTVADLDATKTVNVIGTTKGRGFAGAVKRYGFSGGPAAHGCEKRHRTNGSLASSARLTHVWKGKRMSGHMGDVRETIKNLKIYKIDAEKNLLIVKGSIPGYSGSTVMVVQ